MTTRATIAATVQRALRALADDAGLSLAAVGEQTEGDYTDAIDGALRSIGAVNVDTDLPDVALVTSQTVDTVLGLVERRMLVQLQRHYAVLTDIKVGDRDEKLSQIGAALRAMSSSGSSGVAGGGRVIMRSLRRYTPAYELGTE